MNYRTGGEGYFKFDLGFSIRWQDITKYFVNWRKISSFWIASVKNPQPKAGKPDHFAAKS